MAVTVRRATPADVPALARLYVEFHNFHAEGIPTRLIPVPPPNETLQAAVAKLLTDEKAAVFVGCLDDLVITWSSVSTPTCRA